MMAAGLGLPTSPEHNSSRLGKHAPRAMSQKSNRSKRVRLLLSVWCSFAINILISYSTTCHVPCALVENLRRKEFHLTTPQNRPSAAAPSFGSMAFSACPSGASRSLQAAKSAWAWGVRHMDRMDGFPQASPPPIRCVPIRVGVGVGRGFAARPQRAGFGDLFPTPSHQPTTRRSRKVLALFMLGVPCGAHRRFFFKSGPDSTGVWRASPQWYFAAVPAVAAGPALFILMLPRTEARRPAKIIARSRASGLDVACAAHSPRVWITSPPVRC